MRAYELMIIFPADLEESAIQVFINDLESLAQKDDGSLESTEKLGLRKFAYEIDKKHEGFYVVLQFVAPTALSEIDRTLRISNQVVRHKIVRLPMEEAQKRGLAAATA